MFDSLMSFLMENTLIAEYTNWIVILAAFIALIILILIVRYYRKNKYAIDFWIMNTFYNWPIIGRSYKHKNDLREKDGWTAGETKLCDDFYFEYSRMLGYNDNYYNMCRDYLKKSDEVETEPTPAWAMGILILLVFGEAIIFSRLILEFVSEWSKNEANTIAYGVAVVIAGLLVWLTDRTGKEWHKNSKIRKIRTWQKAENDQEKNSVMIPNHQIELQTSYEDDNDKRYQQLLNRIEKVNAKVKPSYTWTIGTGAVILFIAVIAFIQRATLNIEEIDSTPMAAYATFAFFSLLFIGIQSIGVYIGYAYSFISKQGKIAWEATKRYNTAAEFYRPISIKKDYIKSQAQINLGKLQKRMKLDDDDHRNTFEDFIYDKNKKSKELGNI